MSEPENPEVDGEDASESELESVAPNTEKLQKVLARAGLGSRRELEREIAAGRVSVNGVVAKLGERVSSEDKIDLAGKRVRLPTEEEQELRVILYNKPEGEICTRNDPEGRPTVFANLPSLQSGRWIQIGRLDINTSGALLFTNNGELANKLMHPSSNVDREYLARVRGNVTDDTISNLLAGVELEDGPAKFSDIKESPNNEDSSQYHWFYCVIMEGRNREVRRLWESQNFQVARLKRVRYGNIFIPSHVRSGQWIELSGRELVDVCKTAGLPVPKKPRFKQKVVDQRERHVKKLRSSGSKRNKRR